MNLKMKSRSFITLFFLIVVVLSCGKKQEKIEVISKTEEVKTTDAVSKKEDLKNNNDSTLKKLPDDFPSDFPIYKNAGIMSSSKTPDGSTLTFEIDDNIQAVGDFYKSEMLKNGYKAISDNNIVLSNKGGIITYSKGGREFELKFRYNDAASKTILIISIR
jgi:hypothetical protein